MVYHILNTKFFLVVLMTTGIYTILDAQQVGTNDRGDKIVSYDDGSWRYFEAADSLLENKSKPKETTKSSNNNQTKKQENQAINPKNETPKKSTQVTKVIGNNNNKSFLQFDRTLHHPPEISCIATFNGNDEYTHKKRIDLKKETLFTYTDPQVASYFKGRQYIIGEAFLSEYVGDLRYLILRITINSKTARAEYGYLKSGALLAVKLLDGETVSLYSSSSDVGIIDDANNQTNFKVSFPLSKENQKLLQKSLIDKIRITWSTGYEEYAVYNVDFFQNQISCLNKL